MPNNPPPGSLWRVTSRTTCHSDRLDPRFNLPVTHILEPNTLILVGNDTFLGDLQQFSRPYTANKDFTSKYLWIGIITPHIGWLNHILFNKDSVWLTRIA